MAKNVKSTDTEKLELKAKKLERRDAAKKEELKKARQHRIILIGIVVVLALFAALIIFNKVQTSGSVERSTVVASTENFEVTQSMMTFYFNSLYNRYASLYSSDTTSLNSFIEDINNRGTQYKTLLSLTKSNVDQYLTLAEMAKAEGVELDKADLAEIDETIENYRETKKSYAQTNNAYQIMTFDKFLESMFGDSVNEKVVRECLKLTQLVSKYQEEYTEKLNYTDDELEAYFGENKDSYLYVDYLKYTFSEPEEDTTDTDTDTEAVTDTDAETTEDTAEATEDTDEEIPDENDENTEDGAEDADDATEDTEEAAPAEQTVARRNAEALAATKTADEFNKFMKDYLTEEAKKTLEEGKELDEEEIQTQVDALSNTKKLKGNISEEDAKTWAYDEATKVGDTKLIVDEEKGTYVVYMLTATAHRDEEITRKAAVIYLTDDNNDGASEVVANEIKKEYDADKTEEAFLKLAEKYSEGSHSHIEEGYTSSNSGELADWLFDEARQIGDVGVVYSETNKTSYVVYYGGEGMESWKVSVRSAKRNDDFDSAVSEYKKAHAVSGEGDTATIVTYNEEAIAKVTPISLTAKS